MKKNTTTSLIKEFIQPFIIFVAVASLALLVTSPAMAQSLSETLGQINQGSDLPGFEASGHADASYQPGASNITSAIYMAVDLLKYFLGTIAVLVIIFSGIRLLTAGKQIEDVATQQKENIKWAMIGLMIIILADTLVQQVFFGEQGEVFRSQADAQLAAERGTEQLEGVYNFLQFFVGSIAVLMIVFAGFRMVVSGGNEETMSKSRKQIAWAAIGLMVIGISEFAVKEIIFPDQGERLSDVNQARALIVDITNFISGFVATVAIGFFMYGGFLYVTAAGREDQAGKAKKVFIGATIGIIIALAAFAIVNTFITFDPGFGAGVDGSGSPSSLPTNP